MHKVNLVFIVSFIVLISSSLLFYVLYFNNEDAKFFQSKSERIKSKAPSYKSLFNDIENNSHNNFVSAKQCLTCHELGMEINRKDIKIKTPKIHYKCSNARGIINCNNCHKKE